MQRRGESGQPVKGQRDSAIRPKARKAPTAPVSTTNLQEQLDQRTRELEEALEQQAASAEILKVISHPSFDLQTVFDTIVVNAVRLCHAHMGAVHRFDGELIHIVAYHNFPPEAVEVLRKMYPRPPQPDQASGRAILTRKVAQIENMLADRQYTREVTLAGQWGSILAVPMLRDGSPIGAIVITRNEIGRFADRHIDLLKTFANQAVIAIENARLFNETKEALGQQTATSEVLKVISSSPGELEPVFNAMLSNATRICEAKFGTLYLRDADGFRAVAATRDAPPAYVEARKRELRLQPSPDGPLGRAASTKQVVQIADIIELQSYRDGHPFAVDAVELGKFRTALAAPMLKNDELIGVITIMRQEVRPFTDKQIELVQNFAAQAVIAIENTRLLNELRESLQQQTATADVLKVISRSTFDLQTVLNTLIQSVIQLCGAESAHIFRRTDGTYQVVACGGYSPEYEEYVRGLVFAPGPDSLVGRIALNGRLVHIPDVLADPEYSQERAQKLGGWRTMLGVPLSREGVPVGAMTVTRSQVRPFTDKQIELLTTFADQAVIAIENTRLLNELRESLQQQTATADVLKVISRSTFDLQTVLDTLVQSAARLCAADRGAIIMREGDLYWNRANYGFTREAVRYSSEHPLKLDRGSVTGRVALEGKAIHLPDALADPEYQATGYQQAFGYRTILGVPLQREGSTMGVFILTRDEVNPFTDKQIELVTTFADQAVIAIENVRLFDEVQARTRELSESLEQQTATSEVLQVISSSPGELEPVFNAMLANAIRICEAKFGVLFLAEGDAFRAVALHGVSAAYAEARSKEPVIRPGPGTSLHGAASTRQPVQIADIREEPAYTKDPQRFAVLDLAGARTVLAVPMLKEDKLVGLITIYRQEVRSFTDKQIELVQNFGAQAVIAIENTRLLGELRESLQQQTATADVLKVISRSTFDLQTVLNTLVESAARLCDADHGAITRQIDGIFYRAATYGHSLQFSEAIRDLPVEIDRGSVTGRALVEGRIIQIPDIRADSDFTFSEALNLANIRTALGVPMLREGVPIGVLALGRAEVRPFTDKQIELVSTFADQAAIAIENVRLFESVEARTRELAASLENLRATQDRLVQTQKLASLGQLTAGIAHEIKNPLNFVNNFSGLSAELIDELQESLKDVSLNEKRRSEITELMDTLRGNLDKVVQHGKRADAIVKNMLLHSREGSGEHRVVDINALVEESLNLAYHGARAEKQGFNVTMEQSLDPAAGQADLFPQDVTRVLLNLISNGFYAATRRKAQAGNDGYEPTLAASTKSLGDRVEIRIRDNGTGIPPEVKEKMFNPFFTTKPAGEGTGLGLSICHDIIVKQHGGSIEVDTEPGEFTEIRVILPRAAALLPERS